MQSGTNGVKYRVEIAAIIAALIDSKPRPGKFCVNHKICYRSPVLTDAIDFSQLQRALVIKLRHHGDVLLTSPVFSVLKNHAPQLNVDALVYQDTAAMLSGHPALNQIHCIDRAWKKAAWPQQFRYEWSLLQTLRRRHYDLIIHLTEHPRGAWISRLCAPRYAIARELPGRSRWWCKSFTHFFPWARGNTRHVVEIHLDALRRLGLMPGSEERALIFVPGAEAEAHVLGLLNAAGIAEKSYIHVHPTSRWLFKCWAEEKVTALIAHLQERGHSVVVTCAPDPQELAMLARIIRPLAIAPLNLGGKLTLKQLGALSARAQLFIGVDSAPMHIASAMRTPVLALFGPSGDKEWGPWMTQHVTISSDHSCRPCGQDGCGGSKISECLTTLPVERVLAAALQLLKP